MSANFFLGTPAAVLYLLASVAFRDAFTTKGEHFPMNFPTDLQIERDDEGSLYIPLAHPDYWCLQLIPEPDMPGLWQMIGGRYDRAGVEVVATGIPL
jgi:hypothetical protein